MPGTYPPRESGAFHFAKQRKLLEGTPQQRWKRALENIIWAGGPRWSRCTHGEISATTKVETEVQSACCQFSAARLTWPIKRAPGEPFGICSFVWAQSQSSMTANGNKRDSGPKTQGIGRHCASGCNHKQRATPIQDLMPGALGAFTSGTSATWNIRNSGLGSQGRT